MAKAVSGYEDAKGRLHQTARQATLSDLAAIFGPSCEGMATGIANTILSERDAIERILAEHDAIEPRVATKG